MTESNSSNSAELAARILKTTNVQQSFNLSVLRLLLKLIETLPEDSQKEFESNMNTLIEHAQQLQAENRAVLDMVIRHEGFPT